MSGGFFDYAQYKIAEIADAVERLISNNNDTSLDEWGYRKGHGYSEETIQEFKRALVFLKLAEIYAQRIDWLASGDDGEDSFHRRISEDIGEVLSSNNEMNRDLSALIEAANAAVRSYFIGDNLDEMNELKNDIHDFNKWKDALPQKTVSDFTKGCRVCGIGADGKAYSYVCSRGDCPTRITCTS